MSASRRYTQQDAIQVVQELRTCLYTLYHSPSPAEKNEANLRLIDYQNSSASWGVSQQLLLLSSEPILQMMGAQTLLWKIRCHADILSLQEKEEYLRFLFNEFIQSQHLEGFNNTLKSRGDPSLCVSLDRADGGINPATSNTPLNFELLASITHKIAESVCCTFFYIIEEKSSLSSRNLQNNTDSSSSTLFPSSSSSGAETGKISTHRLSNPRKDEGEDQPANLLLDLLAIGSQENFLAYQRGAFLGDNGYESGMCAVNEGIPPSSMPVPLLSEGSFFSLKKLLILNALALFPEYLEKLINPNSGADWRRSAQYGVCKEASASVYVFVLECLKLTVDGLINGLKGGDLSSFAHASSGNSTTNNITAAASAEVEYKNLLLKIVSHYRDLCFQLLKKWLNYFEDIAIFFEASTMGRTPFLPEELIAYLGNSHALMELLELFIEEVGSRRGIWSIEESQVDSFFRENILNVASLRGEQQLLLGILTQTTRYAERMNDLHRLTLEVEGGKAILTHESLFTELESTQGEASDVVDAAYFLGNQGFITPSRIAKELSVMRRWQLMPLNALLKHFPHALLQETPEAAPIRRFFFALLQFHPFTSSACFPFFSNLHEVQREIMLPKSFVIEIQRVFEHSLLANLLKMGRRDSIYWQAMQEDGASVALKGSESQQSAAEEGEIVEKWLDYLQDARQAFLDYYFILDYCDAPETQGTTYYSLHLLLEHSVRVVEDSSRSFVFIAEVVICFFAELLESDEYMSLDSLDTLKVLYQFYQMIRSQNTHSNTVGSPLYSQKKLLFLNKQLCFLIRSCSEKRLRNTYGSSYHCALITRKSPFPDFVVNHFFYSFEILFLMYPIAPDMASETSLCLAQSFLRVSDLFNGKNLGSEAQSLVSSLLSDAVRFAQLIVEDGSFKEANIAEGRGFLDFNPSSDGMMLAALAYLSTALSMDFSSAFMSCYSETRKRLVVYSSHLRREMKASEPEKSVGGGILVDDLNMLGKRGGGRVPGSFGIAQGGVPGQLESTSSAGDYGSPPSSQSLLQPSSPASYAAITLSLEDGWSNLYRLYVRLAYALEVLKDCLELPGKGFLGSGIPQPYEGGGDGAQISSSMLAASSSQYAAKVSLSTESLSPSFSSFTNPPQSPSFLDKNEDNFARLSEQARQFSAEFLLYQQDYSGNSNSEELSKNEGEKNYRHTPTYTPEELQSLPTAKHPIEDLMSSLYNLSMLIFFNFPMLKDEEELEDERGDLNAFNTSISSKRVGLYGFLPVKLIFQAVKGASSSSSLKCDVFAGEAYETGRGNTHINPSFGALALHCLLICTQLSDLSESSLSYSSKLLNSYLQVYLDMNHGSPQSVSWAVRNLENPKSMDFCSFSRFSPLILIQAENIKAFSKLFFASSCKSFTFEALFSESIAVYTQSSRLGSALKGVKGNRSSLSKGGLIEANRGFSPPSGGLMEATPGPSPSSPSHTHQSPQDSAQLLHYREIFQIILQPLNRVLALFSFKEPEIPINRLQLLFPAIEVIRVTMKVLLMDMYVKYFQLEDVFLQLDWRSALCLAIKSLRGSDDRLINAALKTIFFFAKVEPISSIGEGAYSSGGNARGASTHTAHAGFLPGGSTRSSKVGESSHLQDEKNAHNVGIEAFSRKFPRFLLANMSLLVEHIFTYISHWSPRMIHTLYKLFRHLVNNPTYSQPFLMYCEMFLVSHNPEASTASSDGKGGAASFSESGGGLATSASVWSAVCASGSQIGTRNSRKSIHQSTTLEQRSAIWKCVCSLKDSRLHPFLKDLWLIGMEGTDADDVLMPYLLQI